jgi:hypothetical protein
VQYLACLESAASRAPWLAQPRRRPFRRPTKKTRRRKMGRGSQALPSRGRETNSSGWNRVERGGDYFGGAGVSENKRSGD